MPLSSGLKKAGCYAGVGVVTGFPLAGWALPKDLQIAAAFPPLGGMNHLLEPIASLLIASGFVLATNLKKRRSPSAKFRRGLLLAVVGSVFYLIFVQAFTVRVDFKEDHTYQYRSVGFWRTELGRTDPELKNVPAALAVNIVGTEEEAIERVWAPWSIYLARLLLFASYVLTLGSLNFGFGAVRLDTTDLNI
jgi:hypothetical protein